MISVLISPWELFSWELKEDLESQKSSLPSYWNATPFYRGVNLDQKRARLLIESFCVLKSYNESREYISTDTEQLDNVTLGEYLDILMSKTLEKILHCLNMHEMTVSEAFKRSFSENVKTIFNRNVGLLLDVKTATSKSSGRELICSEIFCAYPVIYRNIELDVKRFLDFNISVLNSLSKDSESLKSMLNIENMSIHDIRYFLGDPHNNNRSTLSISLDNNTRVYYKPSYHGAVELYNFLLQEIAPTSMLPIIYVEASCGGYWMKEVHHSPCDDAQDVKIYYNNLGYALFFFWVCCARDMHYENIIAHGSIPAPIDVECMLHPIDINNLPEGADYNLLNSVASVGILPSKIKLSNFPQQVNVGAIGNNDTGHNAHMPYVGESHYDGSDNMDDLIEGFVACYENCLSLKPVLGEKISVHVNNRHLLTRFIVRPTHIYYNLIDARHHPSFQKRALDFEKMMDWLYVKQSDIRIIPLEIESIVRGDVPYFHVNIMEKHIYSEDKHVENYLTESPFMAFMNRIKDLSRSDIVYQVKVIRASFYHLSTGRKIDEILSEL